MSNSLILTDQEISLKKDKHIIVDVSNQIDKEKVKSFYKWNDTNCLVNFGNYIKTGQFFLYEQFIHKGNDSLKITYPKIGLYVNSYIVDQALEMEWIVPRRTWEYNAEYEYQHNGKTYTNSVSDIKTELSSSILWHDSIMIYGIWDKIPNWKELKKHYERTFWFHRDKDEFRDIQLDRILK